MQRASSILFFMIICFVCFVLRSFFFVVFACYTLQGCTQGRFENEHCTWPQLLFSCVPGVRRERSRGKKMMMGLVNCAIPKRSAWIHLNGIPIVRPFDDAVSIGCFAFPSSISTCRKSRIFLGGTEIRRIILETFTTHRSGLGENGRKKGFNPHWTRDSD